MLAANAGGNNTVRYGNARDLVLGLEVVLADGTIWNGLRRLRKDNTGYCLRQLFVGSEGTLGIITAAVLKLAPRPRKLAVAFCAVPSPQAALDLLALCRGRITRPIQAFELMSGRGLDFVLKHFPERQFPLRAARRAYVLVELADASPDSGRARARWRMCWSKRWRKASLPTPFGRRVQPQRAAIWRLREEMPEARSARALR